MTGVPSEVLNPSTLWTDPTEFNDTLSQLGCLFVNNAKTFLGDASAHVGAEMATRILSGGPHLNAEQAAEKPAATAAKPGAAAAAAAAPAGHLEAIKCAKPAPAPAGPVPVKV